MRKILLFLIALSLFASCSTKYTEKELEGLWVEPIPGMNKVQGIALKEGGHILSIWQLCCTTVGNVMATD